MTAASILTCRWLPTSSGFTVAAWPTVRGSLLQTAAGAPLSEVRVLPVDMLELHKAATELTTEAWQALAAVGVVLCSAYRPFIKVGRDYEGHVLMGSAVAMGRFAALLSSKYPGRFQAPPSEFPRWGHRDRVQFRRGASHQDQS